MLIEKGTQLDQLDLDKHTVVHWAVVCGQLETLQELIEYKAPASTPDLHVGFFNGKGSFISLFKYWSQVENLIDNFKNFNISPLRNFFISMDGYYQMEG